MGKLLHMLPGVRGDAVLSKNLKYRTVLRRWWGRRDRFGPYALFVGMNPSTARADYDDPTIRREIFFTGRFHLTSYMKCNVMDYRTSYPAHLLKKGVKPCREINMDTIRDAAREAEVIVACWGKLPPALRSYAKVVERILLASGKPVYCLGTNLDGSPKHPLYVPGDTQATLYVPPDELTKASADYLKHSRKNPFK